MRRYSLNTYRICQVSILGRIIVSAAIAVGILYMLHSSALAAIRNEYPTCTVNQDSSINYFPSSQSPVVDSVESGEVLTILDTIEADKAGIWYKVNNGFVDSVYCDLVESESLDVSDSTDGSFTPEIEATKTISDIISAKPDMVVTDTAHISVTDTELRVAAAPILSVTQPSNVSISETVSGTLGVDIIHEEVTATSEPITSTLPLDVDTEMVVLTEFNDAQSATWALWSKFDTENQDYVESGSTVTTTIEGIEYALSV